MLTISCWNRRRTTTIKRIIVQLINHMALSFIVCLANIARVHSSCNSEPQHTHTPALIKTIYYNCIILITQMKVCVGFCEWSLESMRIYGMEFHFHTHTRKPMITMNHTELKCLGIRYIFLGPKKKNLRTVQPISKHLKRTRVLWKVEKSLYGRHWHNQTLHAI